MRKELNILTENLQIKAITRYCFKNLNTKIISIGGIANFHFNDEIFEIDKNSFGAFELSSMLAQRTLDVLQISSALNIKCYSDYNVEYFLTNDSSILKSSANIRNLTKIIPISSSEMSSLLKLNI